MMPLLFTDNTPLCLRDCTNMLLLLVASLHITPLCLLRGHRQKVIHLVTLRYLDRARWLAATSACLLPHIRCHRSIAVFELLLSMPIAHYLLSLVNIRHTCHVNILITQHYRLSILFSLPSSLRHYCIMLPSYAITTGYHISPHRHYYACLLLLQVFTIVYAISEYTLPLSFISVICLRHIILRYLPHFHWIYSRLLITCH